MGANLSSLFSSVWTDKKLKETGPHGKLLFIFLLSYHSPSGGKVSGIYEISPKDISFFTSIPQLKVEELLKSSKLNIMYNFDLSIVFIMNKMRYVIGGDPKKNAQSVLGDYNLTSKAKDIWNEFRNRYIKFTGISGGKHRVDMNIIREQLWGEDTIIIPGKRIKTVTQQIIGDRLMEYTLQLEDPEDRQIIRNVFKHLTHSLNNGKLLSLSTQLEILEGIEKQRPEIIAIASHTFVERGCIKLGRRHQYYFGIVRNSATSDFIEWKNKRDRERFELEE